MTLDVLECTDFFLSWNAVSITFADLCDELNLCFGPPQLLMFLPQLGTLGFVTTLLGAA